MDAGDFVTLHLSAQYMLRLAGRRAARVISVPDTKLPGQGRGGDISPSASLIAVAHANSPFITVYNTADWSVVSGVPALAGIGYGCAFSPDGSQLAVAHANSPFITVYNTADWSVVSGVPALAGTGYGCAFSPDGSQLAVAHASGNAVTVYNTADWSVVGGVPAVAVAGYSCAFSPDGSKLAIGSALGPHLTVYNTADWSVSFSVGIGSAGYGVAFSPDGSKLAVAGGSTTYRRLFNVAGWTEDTSIPALPGTGRGCAWLNDNYIVFVHSVYPYVTEIDVPGGVVSWTLPNGNSDGYGIVVKPSVDKTIAGIVADSDGNPVQRTVRAYRRDTGEMVSQIDSDPTAGVFALATPHDGEHTVIALDDEAGDVHNALIFDRVIPA